MKNSNKKNNGCPYHQSQNNKCNHKKGATDCIFEDCFKCQIYRDWDAIRESIDRLEKDDSSGRNTSYNDIGERA